MDTLSKKMGTKFIMQKKYTTDNCIPFYTFQIPDDIINQALSGALHVRYIEKNDNERDPIVSNVNSEGNSVVTNMTFVSYTKVNEINVGLSQLTKYLQNCCKNISKKYYALDIDYEPVNSTLLFYENGDEISTHNHFPHALVSAVYLDVQEGCSPITIGNTTVIYPKTGMCIIFPGHTNHFVEKTKTSRIVHTTDWKAVL